MAHTDHHIPFQVCVCSKNLNYFQLTQYNVIFDKSFKIPVNLIGGTRSKHSQSSEITIPKRYAPSLETPPPISHPNTSRGMPSHSTPL